MSPSSRAIPFLQGMYFQEELLPYIGYVPTDGAVVMLSEALVTTLFQGFIMGPISGEAYEGMMFDRLGQSDLWNTEITEGRIAFTKQYRGRDYAINYVFDRKEGNVWQGSWELDNGRAKGTAWCVVTYVDMAATDPEHLKRVLAK